MASHPTILIPDPGSHGFARRAFAGIVAAANELGGVQLAIRINDTPWSEAVHEARADAAIVRLDDLDELGQIDALAVPMVSYQNDPAIRAQMPIIANDEAAVGRMVADHLLAMGHRQFVTFVHPDRRAYFAPRVDAFVEQVEAAGHAVQHGPPTPAPELVGERDARRRARPELGRWDALAADWLRALPRPFALFGPYDYYAYVAVDRCQQIGLAVPSDVAVVGVDDDDVYCTTARPPLTSVATAAYEIGRRALRAIHDQLAHGTPPPPMTRVPPIGLIVRGSSSFEAVGDPEVAQALRFIRDQAGRAMTVDDVVQHVMISRRSLERRFLAALGRTIREQVRRVRVEQAQRLLVDTDLPLTEVARRSHLMPVQRLHVVLKAASGRTPTAYRSHFRRPM